MEAGQYWNESKKELSIWKIPFSSRGSFMSGKAFKLEFFKFADELGVLADGVISFDGGFTIFDGGLECLDLLSEEEGIGSIHLVGFFRLRRSASWSRRGFSL